MRRRHFLTGGACFCLTCATTKAQNVLPGAPAATQTVRCGTPVPSEVVQQRTQRTLQSFSGANSFFDSTSATFEVPIHFHVIHNGEEGKLTPQRIDEQVAVLNKDYEPAGVRFRQLSVNYVDKPEWF